MDSDIRLSTYLNRPAVEVARDLLGCLLEVELDGETSLVKIVETEAYDQEDVASHSYKGLTPRNEVMFGPAGFLYVYFSYGMHYCCNIVVGKKSYGAAVLIRAVEPISGVELMIKKRDGRSGTEVSNGPAKLCQALGIDKRLNGHNLSENPVKLIIKPPLGKKRLLRPLGLVLAKVKICPGDFTSRATNMLVDLASS